MQQNFGNDDLPISFDRVLILCGLKVAILGWLKLVKLVFQADVQFCWSAQLTSIHSKPHSNDQNKPA